MSKCEIWSYIGTWPLFQVLLGSKLLSKFEIMAKVWTLLFFEVSKGSKCQTKCSTKYDILAMSKWITWCSHTNHAVIMHAQHNHHPIYFVLTAWPWLPNNNMLSTNDTCSTSVNTSISPSNTNTSGRIVSSMIESLPYTKKAQQPPPLRLASKHNDPLPMRSWLSLMCSGVILDRA